MQSYLLSLSIFGEAPECVGASGITGWPLLLLCSCLLLLLFIVVVALDNQKCTQIAKSAKKCE